MQQESQKVKILLNIMVTWIHRRNMSRSYVQRRFMIYAASNSFKDYQMCWDNWKESSANWVALQCWGEMQKIRNSFQSPNERMEIWILICFLMSEDKNLSVVCRRLEDGMEFQIRHHWHHQFCCSQKKKWSANSVIIGSWKVISTSIFSEECFTNLGWFQCC